MTQFWLALTIYTQIENSFYSIISCCQCFVQYLLRNQYKLEQLLFKISLQLVFNIVQLSSYCIIAHCLQYACVKCRRIRVLTTFEVIFLIGLLLDSLKGFSLRTRVQKRTWLPRKLVVVELASNKFNSNSILNSSVPLCTFEIVEKKKRTAWDTCALWFDVFFRFHLTVKVNIRKFMENRCHWVTSRRSGLFTLR